MKEKVYLDTTIPSYIIATPSRDIILLTHQELTREWWEESRENYDLYISDIVILEINGGNREYAQKRSDLLNGIKVLENNSEIEVLVNKYMNHFNFPEKLYRDMYHVAFTVYYKIDFLLTWNFAHLNNAHFKVQLHRFNRKNGYDSPEICNPEEL